VVLLVFVRSLYEQDTEHVCLYGHFFGGVNEAEQILHLGGVFINISMSYFHLHTCHTTLSLAPECECKLANLWGAFTLLMSVMLSYQ